MSKTWWGSLTPTIRINKKFPPTEMPPVECYTLLAEAFVELTGYPPGLIHWHYKNWFTVSRSFLPDMNTRTKYEYDFIDGKPVLRGA